MGLLGRIGGFLNDFYGGGEEEDYDDYGVGQNEEQDDQDDSDKDDSDKDGSDNDDSDKKDDDESGYGDDDDNPSGFGEDEDPDNPNKKGDDPDSPDKEGDDPEKKEDKKEDKEDKKEDKKDDPKQGAKASKLQSAIMKKEAITHGCSPRVEAVPCPICHKNSIYKSYRVFDWFPLLIGARVIGVNLYRYYCFNKRCSKSWYKGYVFNSPTPQFTPASAPTKRQFNAS